MRIIIIGAVQAGAAAAAGAREQSEEAEIVLYEKDSYFSYCTCGMPYYIGGSVKELDELLPWSVTSFEEKFNVKLHLQCEVVQIDVKNKELTIVKQATKEIVTDHYDKLILATGTQPVVPDIEGFMNKRVFTLHNIYDAKNIREYMIKNQPENACIIGSGYIAMELIDVLNSYQMKLTIIEKEEQIMPSLDGDISGILENHLQEHGIQIIKGKTIKKVTTNEVILDDGSIILSEIVFVTTGNKPNVYLATQAGIEVGCHEAILTNESMQTNIEDIYACGDCASVENLITGDKMYHPLAATANKMGRIAGINAAGGKETFIGSLGTTIVACLNDTIAITGLTEKEAIEKGYDINVVTVERRDKMPIFHGENMVIKAVADKDSDTLLGAQIIGKEGVDKRIDIFTALITLKGSMRQMSQMDLCYAPKFSNVLDPVHETALKLINS